MAEEQLAELQSRFDSERNTNKQLENKKAELASELCVCVCACVCVHASVYIHVAEGVDGCSRVILSLQEMSRNYRMTFRC